MRNLRAICALSLLAITSCGDSGVSVDAATDSTGSDAMLSIDRTTHAFGSITLGQTSPPATFQIRNTGEVASGGVTARIIGADATSFTPTVNGCAAALMPGATCDVTITFTPTSSGAKNATLEVSATPGGTVSASLTGDSVALGALSVMTSTNALGSVLVGTTGPITSTFTVTNTGTVTTGALTVQAAGSDPADFVKSADGCATQTLDPAETCTFNVSFAPLTAGAKSALFTISAGPGGSVSGSVSGIALAPANLVVIPQHRNFGSVVTGQISAPLSFLVVNTGGALTGQIGYSISNNEFAPTAASTCAGTQLNAGGSCSIVFEFTPTTTGTRTGQITINAAPGGTVAATLAGIGIAPGGLIIAPSAHAYANTNVGATATSRQFTITNTAATASDTLVTSIAGTHASQFRVIAGTDLCNGMSLAPAAACTISITFAPTAGGSAQATLIVASATQSVTAGLSGIGVGAASLQITPPSRAFGSIVTGTQSAPLAFTVTNLGGQASGVPIVALGGTSAAEFMIAGNGCNLALGPNASCTIQVRFAPTATGDATAALTVMANPGGMLSAALTGTGVAPGGIVIIPSAFTFPPTALGDMSATQTLSVQNTGTATTGTIALTATGDFATTANTCTTLTAGASCSVTVRFTPTALGQRTGSVTATASPGGAATSALSGLAIPRIEIVALNLGSVVTPFDFGTTVVNTTTPQDVRITVRNNTSTQKPLALVEMFAGQYSVVSNTCSATNTIDSGATCVIGVRFRPTSAGTKTGSITFSIGAGASNEATQNLTGVGTESLTIIPLNGTGFGLVSINTTSTPLSFRVVNPAGSVTSGTIATSVTGTGFAIAANACSGVTLAGGGSCLIDVTYTPGTSIGPATGTLTATANPGGMPSVVLTATGVDPTGVAPTDLALTPSSIAEDAPTASTVGTFTTTDADVGNTFTYALVGGPGSADNVAFTISGALLQTAGPLDFETKSSYAIRVRVTDSGGQIFEKAITVTVTNVDEAPVAVNDAITVVEDAAATVVDVLANDTDIDAGLKMIMSITQPPNGSVMITGGGTGLTYRPNANFFGTDTFSYTLNGGSIASVNVTVTPVDDPPVAVADTATIPEDSAATAVNVLANDTDVDGGPISIGSVTQPAHGVVAITGGGTGVTYQPTAQYSGPDTFTYTLNGGSTATVAIDVAAVDDPPTAVDDLGSATEDQSAIVDVLANDTDTDGGPKMVIAVTQGTQGSVSISPGGVSVQYTPNPNINGGDTFTYTLNGGSTATVTMVIASVDDPPVAVADSALVDEDVATSINVLANDTDIDGGATMVTSFTDPPHGTVTVNPGGAGVTYTSDLNYCNAPVPPGTVDTFMYTLNGGSATTVSVTVTCVNDAPVLASTITLGTLPEATYTEDMPAVAIDTTFTITDVDSPMLASATITITNVQPSDVLSYVGTTTPGITVLSNVGGVLVLSGSDTIANYQAALRNVFFNNPSQTPSITRRTVTFQVDDGPGPNDLSNVVTDTIDVIDTPDGPILTGDSSTLAYTEDDATGVLVNPTMTVTDANSLTLLSATVQITTGFEPASGAAAPIIDELVFVNAGNISGVYDRVTGVLALSCTSTCAPIEFETAFRSVRFRTTSQNPTVAKALAFTATDTDIPNNVSNTLTRNITVTRNNDAPSVTTTASALAYAENAGAVAVDPGVTVTDLDLDQLSGATVSITGGFDLAQDTLGFTNQLGITGSYNSTSGVMTLSGMAPVADYRTALASVTYANSSDAPTTATRTVSFQVTDVPGALSNIATRDITITAANDAPVLDATKNPVVAPVSEDAGAPGVGAGTLVSNLVDFAAPSGGLDNVTDLDSGPLLGIAITATNTTNGAWSYSTNNGTTWFALGGETDATARLLAADAATRVYFQPNTDFTGTISSAITFRAWDQTAGSNGSVGNTVPNGGPTAFSFATDTASILVSAVNDAPSLDATKTPALASEAEDAGAPVGAVGTLIASLVDFAAPPGQVDNVTDPDAGALLGIAITNRSTTNGTWYYSTNGGTSWTAIPAVTTASALLLAADATTRLYFQPNLNVNGVVSDITFQAWDQTTGSNGGMANVTVGGGTSAFSIDSDDAAITINAVNDAPVLTAGATLNHSSSSPAAIVDNTITANDVDNSDLAGATVQITTGYVTGEDVLAYTNSPPITATWDANALGGGKLTFTGGDTLTDYAFALKTVRYSNTAGASATVGARTVTWIGTDGTDPSAPVTSTINVSINAAPVVTTSGGTTPYTEGTAAVAIDGSVTVTDTDDTNIESGQVRISVGFQPGDDLVFTTPQNGIALVYASGTGILTLTGTSLKANYQTALQSIQYRSTTNDNPSASKTVEFKVNDGSVDSNLAIKVLAITPVNDAPVLANTSSVTFTEGVGAAQGAAVVVNSGITVTDPDNSNIASATVEVLSDSPGDELLFTNQLGITGSYLNGILSLTSTAPPVSPASYQIALQSVTFRNTSDNPVTTARTVRFIVNDGLPSNQIDSTVNVVGVNDAPVVAPGAMQLLGYTEQASPTDTVNAIVNLDPSIDVTDVDSNLTGATISLSTSMGALAEDHLFVGTLGGLAVSGQNTASITLSGSASPAVYQTAIRSITYQDVSHTPLTLTRTVTVVVNDGVVPSASHAPWMFTVTPVNDAPVADDETFNAANSAVGNTALVVDAPGDGPQTLNAPKKSITGDILNGDADLDGPGPLVVSAGTFASNDGGTVVLEADGDFTYTPAAGTSCTDTSDFFDYTVSDQNPGTPATDFGRVTIAISGCVWYVNNNAAGNSGTSTAPFDTLAQAETASAAGHTIFVSKGDGTTGGMNAGILLKPNQRLLGEAVALVIGSDTLAAAVPANRPVITDTADDVVVLAAGDTISGVQLDPQGVGNGGIFGNAAAVASGTIADVTIIDSGTAGTGPGIELNNTTGTFNISDLTVNTNGGIGIRLNNAGTVNFASGGTISITASGAKGLDVVSTNMGAGSVFDDISVSNSATGCISMTSTSGTTTFGDGVGNDLALATSSGGTPAFLVNSALGTITVPSGGSTTVSATGGAAIDLNLTTGLSLAFDTVSSSSSGNKGIRISGLGAGTFSATSGSISSPGGVAFDLDGGSGAVSYPGMISKTADGATISIQNRSGGTVTIGGTVSSTGSSDGFVLALNTGGTINFTSTLTIDTSASGTTGFSATGGGTISATGSGSTINSGAGTALNVANTAIGAGNLTFQSISANGAANGIVLNNTGASGGLTVSGTGSAGSGGTIQSISLDGISLTSTQKVSLTNVAISNVARNGIDGVGVVDFALTNSSITNTGTAAAGQYDENAIAFVDQALVANTLSGSVTITNNTITQPRRNGIMIETWNGTISNIVVSSNTLSGGTTTADIQDAIHVFAQGTATQTAHITTGTFQNNTISGFSFFSSPINIGGNGIRIAGGSGNGSNNTIATLGAAATPIEISGNDVDFVGSNAIAVSFNGQQGLSNFNIHNNGTNANRMTNMEGLGISVFFGGSGTFSSLVNNNFIDTNGPTVHAGSAGIGVQADDGPAALATSTPNATITVNNNTVGNPDGIGIRGIVRASNGTLNLKVQNNTVGNKPFLPNRNAIRIDSGSGAGNTTLCLNMTGNATAGGSGVNAGLGLRKQGTVAGVNSFGMNGLSPSPTTGANAAVKANADNPSGGATDILSGDNFVTCSLP